MTCGEICWIDLGIPLGQEPGFRRPALVIQSDSLNESRLGTTLVIPLTTNVALADYRGNGNSCFLWQRMLWFVLRAAKGGEK